MFIPSMYKSLQIVTFTTTVEILPGAPTTVAIPIPVVMRNTRVTLQGWESNDGSGFLAVSQCRYKLTDVDEITIYSTGRVTSGTYTATFIVEEFTSFFIRQAIYYNDITITNTNTSNTHNSGLTLNNKAFVIHLGNSSNLTSGGPNLESDVNTRVSLDTGTGIVTLQRIDDFGDVTASFAIIDPR